jgi:hypothetical protein
VAAQRIQIQTSRTRFGSRKNLVDMRPTPAADPFSCLNSTASRLGRIAEQWAIQADAERRYHFRPDSPQIDQTLALIVHCSLVFGNRDPEE